MSDQIMQMVNETKETGRQFTQSYQAVWMSRWKRTGCKSTTNAHNDSSNAVPKMKLDCAMEEDDSANKLNVSRTVKGHEGIVTKAFEIVNEGLRMSSESLRKEGMGFQDQPMVPTANCGSGFLFQLGQDTDDIETSRYAPDYNFDRVTAVGCKTEIRFPGTLAPNDIILETCRYRDEGDGFVKSSSEAGPFIFETSVRSFMGRSALISSNQFIDTELRLGERAYHQYHEVDGHSRPRNSATVSFRESNTSSFLDPPSMSSHRLSALGGEWFQEMQKVPKCRHNVETMRICTAMDSAVDPGGSLPRFCQAIHSLRITKKTDFNLENDIFRSTRISGDIPSDVCNLSPFYGQGKRGLKIESLSNFTNSESRGNHVKDSGVTAKNESSVQEKDPLSGAISSPSKTVNNMCSTLSQYQCIKVSAH